VLLVENHDDTRHALQRLLARRGYRVEVARDSASALALCAAHEFDVVVSDIGLPDRSGLELMQEIKNLHRIPGIAISGFGMDTDVAKSVAAGFSEHLTKPGRLRESGRHPAARRVDQELRTGRDRRNGLGAASCITLRRAPGFALSGSRPAPESVA